MSGNNSSDESEKILRQTLTATDRFFLSKLSVLVLGRNFNILTEDYENSDWNSQIGKFPKEEKMLPRMRNFAKSRGKSKKTTGIRMLLVFELNFAKLI